MFAADGKHRLGWLLAVGLAAGALAGGCGDEGDEPPGGGSSLDDIGGDTPNPDVDVDPSAGSDGGAAAGDFSQRLEEIIAEVKQTVPTEEEAAPTLPEAEARPATMYDFLTDVLTSVDGYWTQTLTNAGVQEPFVNAVWLAPGLTRESGCVDDSGQPGIANDSAAFYCPADDTIYFSQVFASDIWNGVFEGGKGIGRPVGDFAVAYAVAHEFAHSIQAELGLDKAAENLPTVAPLELQADCMAGLWSNSVYYEGRLEPGDVEEALAATLALGDFDYQFASHHGTPAERHEAWSLGYNTGDPAECNAYLQ